MPITITSVGTTLDATIHDGNFDNIYNYLNEQILNGEINLKAVRRMNVRRYSQGKLVSSSSLENEFLDDTMDSLEQANSVHEVTWRGNNAAVLGALKQRNMMMEFLGIPGPSFYWQYQEDGITYSNPATVVERFNPEHCYSYWLTIPGCSLKAFVKEPCLARVHGRAYFMSSVTAIAEYIKNGPGLTDWQTDYATHGREIVMRLGLIVDTNPNRYTDEFTNSNSNILHPPTGIQAATKSWKVIEDKPVHTPLWQREGITGTQVLKGGRNYNFSMKYRGAGAVGYIDGSSNFVDGIYEYDVATPNYSGSRRQMAAVPPYEVQWLSTSLHVEFIYGYTNTYDDTSNIPNAAARNSEYK